MNNQRRARKAAGNAAARRLKRIVEADPAGLRRFGRYARSGVINSQYNHYIYILLVVVPVLTFLVLLFYMVAVVDGALNGTPESEVDQVISSKIVNAITLAQQAELEKVENKLHEESEIDQPASWGVQSAVDAKGSTKSAVDEDLKKRIQAQTRVENPFRGMNFRFKLVPPWGKADAAKASQTFYAESALIQRMTLVSDSVAEAEHSDYDEDAVGDIDSKEASPQFFKWNRYWRGDRSSFEFTPVTFDQESVPLGDSQRFCLGLQYANETMGKHKDGQSDLLVTGFDQCYGAIKGHGRWQSGFPEMGLSFRTWIQMRRKVPPGESDCSSDTSADSRPGHFEFHEGLEVPELVHGGYCYSYAILRKICLLVKYQKERDNSDFENGSYAWTFTGGCFQNNHALLYEPAEVDQIYEFRNLPIEVRLDHRYSEFFRGEDVSPPSQDQVESESTALVTKTHEASSSAALADMVTTVPAGRAATFSDLSEQTRHNVNTLRKELEQQKKKGEIQAEGWYPVQKLAMFLSRCFLFIDCVCLLALFVCFMGMLCIEDPATQEERRKLVKKKGKSKKKKKETQMKAVKAAPPPDIEQDKKEVDAVEKLSTQGHEDA